MNDIEMTYQIVEPNESVCKRCGAGMERIKYAEPRYLAHARDFHAVDVDACGHCVSMAL